MNSRISVKELAAQLTEEEKESILRHGKLGKVASYLTIPAAFLVVISFALPLFNASGNSITDNDSVLTACLLAAAGALIVVSVVLYFITKKNCPKYKETLFNYLKQQQGK